MALSSRLPPMVMRADVISHLANPWAALPDQSPYILPQDKVQLESHGVSPESLRLDLGLLPVPWNGTLESASVVLLTLNPSVRLNAALEEQNTDYREAILANLRFGNNPPFFSLDERFHRTGGCEYWQRLLRTLVVRFGVDRVSHRIMCIQYFPYRSETYRNPPCVIPSQRFSWALAAQAVTEGRVIVVQRSLDRWADAVPGLRGYPYILLSNRRSPFLSEGNMPAADWSRVVRALSN